MKIGFINDHKVKPQFTPGKEYTGKVVEAEDKDSGFTLKLAFEEISTPAFWHFSVAETVENEDAKRISADELKGILEQVGIESIEDSAELVGVDVTVRLLEQDSSTLPRPALPVTKKKGAKELF